MIASPESSASATAVHRLLGDLAGRDHHPDGARGAQLRGQLLQRGGAVGALARQLLDHRRVDVVDDAVVAVAHQATDDVRSHPPQADHSQLHASSLRRSGVACGRMAASGKPTTAARPADVLVIFGITGDLAKKMTFRALYRLESRGKLDCPIVGVGDRRLGRRGPPSSTPARRSPRRSRTPTATSSRGSPTGSPTSRATTPTPTPSSGSGRRSARRSGRSSTSRCRPPSSPPSSTASASAGLTENATGGDREAVRPRPRLRPGAQRRPARGAARGADPAESTTSSARSR